MKWRCPVQHKSVKDRKQWLRLAPVEGPFHRDYRQMHDQPTVRYRARVWLQHRLSQANPEWPIPQRTALHRTRNFHHPQTGIKVDSSHPDNNLPPSGIRKRPETSTTPLRVLWLCASEAERPKTTGLRNRFGSEGMAVHIANIQQTNGQTGNAQAMQQFPTVFELIMLECVEISEETMLTQLSHIRETSQAPLIVLTDNYTLDWSLRALREGADAIFTLNTPDDVIVARSNALLRRWA